MKFAKYAALRPSSAGVQYAADYRPSPMAWTDILTRELDDELVPEWRAKYLDYKAGKKKLKSVARALRNVNSSSPRSPRTLRRRTPRAIVPAAALGIGQRGPLSADGPRAGRAVSDGVLRTSRAPGPTDSSGTRISSTDHEIATGASSTRPLDIPSRHRHGSHVPGSHTQLVSDGVSNYGSFVLTPPEDAPPRPPSILELPDPALDPDTLSVSLEHPSHPPRRSRQPSQRRVRPSDSSQALHHAYEVGKTHAPSSPNTIRSSASQTPGSAGRRGSAPPSFNLGPLVRRLLAHHPSKKSGSQSVGRGDVPLEAYRELDQRQRDFFTWQDRELDKIETFYQEKEEEAKQRLTVLRDQLHEMRKRRLRQLTAAQRDKARVMEHGGQTRLMMLEGRVEDAAQRRANGPGMHWLKSVENAFDRATGRPVAHVGKNTKAIAQLGTPSGPVAQTPQQLAEHRRDFVRKHSPDDGIPYRQAKRKLKMALVEYYRGLELLKSYALLNRTAFYKLNKKFDKTVNARPAGRYMADKVNSAWFVQSGVLESHLQAVEDLYARYFERGNHKIAVGKLRTTGHREGMFHSSVYQNGFFLGAGAVLSIQALVYATELLSNPRPTIVAETQYLFQIYAGYFLGLLLFLLFCFDCSIWTRAKINYVFIFEFDTRHSLDWRQLAEMPCFFFFLEGLIMWLNFSRVGGDRMYVYWPVIMIGLTVAILFFPAKILYYRSRQWWLYSNWRLLLAGLYPVEFRDFFLGDMYCSMTYSMGNLELFFCLYAQYWSNPGNCNSTHSRLLGFFSTLPGIWRALQCVRRYHDTRNIFPHLVNGGKYTMTILYYMSLSLYRIDESTGLRALFIVCAAGNSIYTSIWDVAMDWSLGNPYAKHPFLRDVLGYKHVWLYYVAMVVDPLLRCNWIFYVIFSQELQHSASLSFFIALSEVFRRGMWTLIRVENEHCTNVGRFRASRDIPLPYDLEHEHEHEHEQPSKGTSRGESGSSAGTGTGAGETDADADAKDTPPPPGPALLAVTTTSTLSPHETIKERNEATPSARTSPSTFRQRRRSAIAPSSSPLGATSGIASGIASTGAASPVQRGIARVGTLMASAHAQDFERRRRPELRSRSTTATTTGEASRGGGGGGGRDEEDGEGEESGQQRRGGEEIDEASALLDPTVLGTARRKAIAVTSSEEEEDGEEDDDEEFEAHLHTLHGLDAVVDRDRPDRDHGHEHEEGGEGNGGNGTGGSPAVGDDIV
ncbi:MAG: hypothetical protein M1838_005869 [Thelocarpon superellum]|nr:MAG: hypothetical protein M1838_005869 [Thelocarpon superellum]